MRIAYVEDNPTNLALVERICGMNHHSVVSYSEGEVAIQQLVREKFDLILMDVELAGEIGGLQVVRHLRRVGLKTPIIAVTAYAMMGDRERCLEAGCDGYLPKPLPINELLVLLAKYETPGGLAEQPAPAATPAPVVAPAPALVSEAKVVETARPAPVAAPVAASPAPPVPVVVAVPPVVTKPEPVVPAVSSNGGSAPSAPVAPAVLTEPTPSPVIAPLPIAESQPAETPPALSPKVETAAEPSKPDEIGSLRPS